MSDKDKDEYTQYLDEEHIARLEKDRNEHEYLRFRILGWLSLGLSLIFVGESFVFDMNAIQELSAVTAFGVLSIMFFMKSK